MGEGAGGGVQNRDHLVPPPFCPLPPEEGRYFVVVSKMLEINSQTFGVNI